MIKRFHVHIFVSFKRSGVAEQRHQTHKHSKHILSSELDSCHYGLLVLINEASQFVFFTLKCCLLILDVVSLQGTTSQSLELFQIVYLFSWFFTICTVTICSPYNCVYWVFLNFCLRKARSLTISINKLTFTG